MKRILKDIKIVVGHVSNGLALWTRDGGVEGKAFKTVLAVGVVAGKSSGIFTVVVANGTSRTIANCGDTSISHGYSLLE